MFNTLSFFKGIYTEGVAFKKFNYPKKKLFEF